MPQQFSATHPEWTLSHAFLADMGGLVLTASDLKHPIPIDAKQVFYLFQHGYIEFPNVSIVDIEDRNKADGLAR